MAPISYPLGPTAADAAAGLSSDFREGDVFRWAYRDPKLDQSYLSYWGWAKSRIAIVINGVLCDTYWGKTGGDVTWSPADASARLDLTYVGNLGDYDRGAERDAVYYDDTDCLDLNHANSSKGNFYIRKDAKRSEAKIRETIRLRRESVVREVGRLDALDAEIVAGKPLSEVYL